MAPKFKVLVMVGSLRTGSFSRMTARALSRTTDALECEIAEIGMLPLYNEDLEKEGPPQDWIAFRDRVRASDAVLFVTPEYNRSIPGCLKNAIDVGSRPYGKSVFEKKPAGIVSISTGAVGGFGANHHLRQCLVFLDMPAMQGPEVYIANIAKYFDDQGKITVPETEELLRKFMAAFTTWIDANHLPRHARAA
ncbi:NADPH-dependent FMN reductase [Usitatibacter palustris]|uniref:Quinone reductase n=1 Tax=Usitatibacter palustris TaxID=2732487 RepID=A0A6M4HB72_9PROT|nr:NADPH-dependent FMN reductase [Usitatibacter palustris]QJR15883.1 Quinone reductase [Usitatibacter palustris]